VSRRAPTRKSVPRDPGLHRRTPAYPRNLLPNTQGHVPSVAAMRVRFDDKSGESTIIGRLRIGAQSPETLRLAIDARIAPALSGH
jgi:hypothetical protein